MLAEIPIVRRIESARHVEAELIGTLLRTPADYPDVADIVRPADFHFRVYAGAFEAMGRLHARHEPVDLVGLADELRRSGVAADCPNSDPYTFAAEVYEQGGSSADMQASRVLALSLERGIAGAVSEALSDIESPSGTPTEILDRIQERFAKLAERGTAAGGIGICEAVNDYLSLLDARKRGDVTSGVPTGFRRVDEDLCGGMPVGQVILGARPSVGKTAFSLHVARNVCARGGAVFIASLEQPAGELVERVMAAESSVNGKDLRSGSYSRDEGTRVLAAADPVRYWRLEINDAASQSAGQIAAAARAAKRTLKGLDLIVVDYLQLVTPDNQKANRNDQVGQVARKLREMGRTLECPVLVCCQLNRLAADEVPSLHHLRDSGEIEQHADVVMFLHRAEVWQAGKPDRIDLHIAKQRQGPRGVTPFEHESRHYTFSETSGIIL